MTVVGIGLDVVDVPGFASQLADTASGWVDTVFTTAEQRRAAARPGGKELHLAGWFAAKEAFVKAWSASRRGHAPALASVDLRHVEVVADSYGRPALRLSGQVADAVAASCGADLVTFLSVSHDGPVAAAMVVLERPS